MVWAILEPSNELTCGGHLGRRKHGSGGAGEENPGEAAPAAVLTSDKGFGQLRVKPQCEGVRSWGQRQLVAALTLTYI